MTIVTKFNVDDFLILIENNRIIRGQVKSVNYAQSKVQYHVLLRKSTTLNDKDVYVYRDEDNCFDSIDSLAAFYKNI